MSTKSWLLRAKSAAPVAYIFLFFIFFLTEEVESALARKVDQSLLSYMWPLVLYYMVFQFPYVEREIPTQIFT